MGKFELSQSFYFEAAHTLSRTVPLPEYAASMTVHGHSYLATVTVSGGIGASGMVGYFRLPKNKRVDVDLFYLRKSIAEVRSKLDHKLLDNVEGLKASTLEHLCLFIQEHIKEIPISSVTVSRPSSGDSCTYTP